MKLLEEKIQKEGRVLDGNILKVDNFLNHQIDVMFLHLLYILSISRRLYRPLHSLKQSLPTTQRGSPFRGEACRRPDMLFQ